MKEIWKDIEGYEGYYQVSNTGKVRSLDRRVTGKDGITQNLKGRELVRTLNNKGYYTSCLCKNSVLKTVLVSRLVAKHFVKNPKNEKVVDHIDDNPKNNNYKNLRWCTQSFNIQKAHNLGRAGNNLGEASGSAKLDNVKVLTIVTMIKSGITMVEIAKHFGMSYPAIASIKYKKSWTHITKDLL